MSVLVVVTILEGKQFPSKPKSELQITCKFANEVLHSDSVPHTSAPYFNTELAWELTKKTLHQHRLQRTPLKLTFFTKIGKTSEEVGHIMLDLRTISNDGSEYKWYPLARSKYKTHKPQIRLMLSTEDADQAQQMESENPKKLFVSLDEASGCYQVGEPQESDPVFTLSLTLIAAADLIHLIDSSEPAAFCFRFNLLENIITNSSFVNAAKPDFPIERVSVKLRGLLENIYKYLAAVKDISIQLCQGTEVVGVANLPFTKLLTAPEDSECINSFHTCLNLQPTAQGDHIGEEKGNVEVHFTLREDGKPRAVPQILEDKTRDEIERRRRELERQEERRDEEERRLEEERRVTSSPRPISPVSPPSPKPQLQGDSRSWLCTIQLKSAILNKSGKRYVRYVYPFFGTTAPHSTSVIKFIAGDVTPLPPSSCEYSFAADTESVLKQFSKVPLVLQFWNKDGDFLEGTSVVPLSALVKGGFQEMPGKIISKRDEVVMGEVVMSGWLEDKGAISSSVLQGLAPKKQQQEESTEDIPPRQQASYKTALELELWKETEQAKFLKELEERREMRLKQITEEWKRKEAERGEEARRQLAEYGKLKEKMKVALKDLEIRENQLVEQERRLLLSQEDLARERARLTSEVREASRRVEEEFEHKLSLQKQKLAALDRHNKDLKVQLEEAEARLAKRTAELAASREAQLTAPSTKIQTQLELIKMEKEEMERKITSLEKAKLHYKESWTKALKELINVRERGQQDAKRRLHQEQSLMEHARLRYLTVEDQKLKDKTQLGEDVENLKGELNKIREQIHVPESTHVVKGPESVDKTAVYRLIEERNSLLNTGIYTKDDKLVRELNNKINLLSAS